MHGKETGEAPKCLSLLIFLVMKPKALQHALCPGVTASRVLHWM